MDSHSFQSNKPFTSLIPLPTPLARPPTQIYQERQKLFRKYEYFSR
jgi:hypothetical protein